MTALEDRPVNGHKHNGHPHSWVPFPIQTVGPAEPMTQPLPAVDTTPQAEPEPELETTEVGSEPTRVPEPPEAPELPPLPELPAEPTFDVDREYWGHRALVAVYWIAILTGAVGQVAYFGDLFGLGKWGYAAAVVIATTAETVMVTSCDTALKHRVHGAYKRRWLPFMFVAFSAAFAASVMNLTHFWHSSPSLGLLFGGVSLLGFLLHVMDGFVKGSDHLDRKAKYDQAVNQRQTEQRQRAEAAYERQLAEYETQRQAAERALERAEARTEQPAPKSTSDADKAEQKPTKPAKGSGKGKATTPELTREAAREWSQANGNATQAAVRKHFESQGYRVPSENTVRRWLNGN